MPFIERGSARIYYEDAGEGEAILTNHGLMEDANYWSETGVTARLAENYRVVSMDMRGHGRTVVENKPYGFDVGTMANDFGGLADALGIERFHILTHATGGMAAVRYAMTSSERLISLMLTDTGSATAPEFPGVDPVEMQQGFIEAAERRKTATVEEWLAGARAEPGPFLFKMDEHPDKERMWKIYEGFLRRSDPVAIGNFMQSFYSDADPMVEGLRQIKCPTLVLLGEFDIVFLGASEIMAKEIPNAKHVIIEGIGHMTAIEDSERTIKELLDFLNEVKS
ncbi:MAG: alpha/beta hydrolase [Deltaproteobacteria bacterium]|nr:alpha/beta hydrolase [Deltaproteobacteria bacterium]MBW2051651.1 alpha/beta hydrolase [Deltaproteobacteria bacterium]MBW2141318.1 alpha/beta hydrolase [Deltaproteobacteria bacterium]MBW2322394.1 alpha/beta hydrolase [Deltaproteobacteria bacterium]